MGLLYEKERRAVRDKSMPDVKEADSLKRPTGKVVPLREGEADEEWDELDGLVENDLVEDELDAEGFDDEEL